MDNNLYEIPQEYSSKKDYDWQKILDKLNIDIPMQHTQNFKQDYFVAMNNLIVKIKNNPYVKTVSFIDKETLIHDLYNLGRMFYGYRSKINEYYKTYDKNNYEKELIPKWKTYNGYLPTSHNYNTYLHRLTPALFENYYLLQVNVIQEFVNSAGKQPKYLYELIDEKEKRLWFVKKLELFTKEDINIDIDNLRLPNYYAINVKYGDVTFYEESYAKCSISHYFEAFLKEEYPIYKWIKENRKDVHWDREEFYNDIFEKPIVKIVNHLRLCMKKDDLVTIEELSYYYGIEYIEVISIINKLVVSKHYQEKIETYIDKNDKINLKKKVDFL